MRPTTLMGISRYSSILIDVSFPQRRGSEIFETNVSISEISEISETNVSISLCVRGTLTSIREGLCVERITVEWTADALTTLDWSKTFCSHNGT
jgi:hypothetical protein